MTGRPIVCLLLSAALVIGCGGSSGGAPGGDATAPGPPSSARGPLNLPAGVPLTASGSADPADARVVRAWSAALRHGDVVAATALWAVPSKVQNGTPVLTLSTPADVRLFNGSLPCGSVVTSTGAAKGYTIATFRLTKRKGGDCDAAAGATARCAIRVRDGKIVEWYRLPDAPGSQPDDVDSTVV